MKLIMTFLTCALLFLCCDTSSQATNLNLQWARQLGDGSRDSSYSVSADPQGNVYITGQSDGSLGGPNVGSTDAFVAKYDAAGALVWTAQLGTSLFDTSFGIAADSLGNVFITGYTFGGLGGQNAGNADAYIAKIDALGTLEWEQQIATSDSDHGLSIATDLLGNAYVTGSTSGDLFGPSAGDFDTFLAKYDTTGALIWSKQFGTNDFDASRAVSTDLLGNVYLAGTTRGNFDGSTAGKQDLFLVKYDAAGTLLWKEQFGSIDNEASYGVSADALGNVFVTGWTEGSLGGPHEGDTDVFLAKFNETGTHQWTEQIGTGLGDLSYGVSTDSDGNVYISGGTRGSLFGPNVGDGDVFLAKYDGSGQLLWGEQFGTGARDTGYGVVANSLGMVFISGETGGSLFGSSGGQEDAILAMYAIPEPSTNTLSSLGLACLVILGAAHRRQRLCIVLLGFFAQGGLPVARNRLNRPTGGIPRSRFVGQCESSPHVEPAIV